MQGASVRCQANTAHERQSRPWLSGKSHKVLPRYSEADPSVGGGERGDAEVLPPSYIYVCMPSICTYIRTRKQTSQKWCMCGKLPSTPSSLKLVPGTAPPLPPNPCSQAETQTLTGVPRSQEKTSTELVHVRRTISVKSASE